MIKKLLIANRGEIAVRVIRACRELGIATVAVYSDVDRTAMHVRVADEAYHIGEAPPRLSYLSISRLVEVAVRTGADAVHPGYGFLAENPLFAQACQEAGLIFVGPDYHTIRLLGDKVEARRFMRDAGIPIVPGSDEHPGGSLEEAAEHLGYPLLIKAAAGGGGKGMRLVRRLEELGPALEVAQREAATAFGDDTVYLERIVRDARHIEFQILGDGYGNVIHLGDRECSIQRRHQKVIEETPSRALSEEQRREMGEVALRAARAAHYRSAGTVEFLVDAAGAFYFLEVNPRLQVEHPVSEMVTGVDIVKEQLRIAAGRKLRYRQEDIQPRGWSIECRILAEDPYSNFAPSTGRITGVYEPAGPGIRVESGVYDGFEVTPYYDSLIAKVIVWGETRGDAILRMLRALDEFRISGIKTNIPFCQQLFGSASFIGGQFDTTYLEQRFSLSTEHRREQELTAALAAAYVEHAKRGRHLSRPLDREVDRAAWRLVARREAMGD
ncbi:MAG: acetyl-CoA carboxylase biotin carboxylase subunit [Anaerolineae bacterium]|nr:acetyl-CoA carboxylase biotin carboxylase subunit [Anaerolineae bacterium]